jgi:lipopolysaccharide/colanic/teichoic acid biosynthesis glycosyltransferase
MAQQSLTRTPDGIVNVNGYSQGNLALAPPAPTHVSSRKPSGVTTVAKRTLDVLVGAVGLLLLLPLMLITALLVKLESRGPVFYRCTRAGHRGRELSMLKFRKMHDGATGLALTTSADDRFTRVGRVLARTKLDELPQLWHVLRGEMSLVGPRPEDHAFVARHQAHYDRILSIRPGIIGLSQLAFADEASILDPAAPEQHYLERILPQKLGLDLMYVERHSVWFDIKILMWSTVAVLARREVAVDRSTGRMGLRRR